MLFITGLLTLLAIAQAGGDHIKGGIKGGSTAQQKIAQEDIIPSPFNVRPVVAPFGSKVVPQEVADPLSKTARGAVLHHAIKTAATTPGKTQLSPGLHHAASSPVVQDQVTIVDPASGTIKNIKTVKSIQDPVSGARQIKTVKTVDPVNARFTQDDKQIRDPISSTVFQTVKGAEDPAALSAKGIKSLRNASTKTRFTQEPVAEPIIQTVKTSEDPSASVVTKTVKTTVKTSDPVLRSKIALKTSQKNVNLQRISNAPFSAIEAAKRNTFTSPSLANIATLSSRGEIPSSEEGQRLLLNSVSGAQMQPGSELVTELGEMILDEETLRTLQNAGGITNENGRIALNDEGIKVLQSIRGGGLSSYSAGVSRTETGRIQSGTPSRISSRAGSAALTSLSTGMSTGRQTSNTPILRSQVGSSQGSQGGRIRSSNLRSSTTSAAGDSRSIGLSSPLSTSNTAAGMLSANVLSGQSPQGTRRITSGGSVVSGTALFNGKEINIEGLKEGQLFDENLRPVMSDIGRIEAPGSVAPKPGIRAPQRAESGSLRTSSLSGITRSTGGSAGTFGMPGMRIAPNVRAGSSGASISTSQRNSQAMGMTRTTSTLTSGTALFNGKEIAIDGLKEGQLFDENLKPLSPGSSIPTSGQISGVPSRSASSTPRARTPQIFQSARLRTSTVTGTSRGTSRTSSMPFSQPAPSLRAAPLTTSISSGQIRTQAVGGTRSGAPLPSGAVLFNGKEINVDGLKEGQLFDENLRPITPGASITTTSVPSRNINIRPIGRSPQRLRSSTVSTSRGSMNTLRAPNVPQPTPFMAGPLGAGISSGQGSFQGVGGISDGSPLTSGTVLFNGKEISVNGIKEGQIFDENLQPILPGFTGTTGERPTTIMTSGDISNTPLGNAAQIPRAGVKPTGGLRSSVISSTSRDANIASNAFAYKPESITQFGSLSNVISSEAGITKVEETSRLGGPLTSGKVLFNGEEINIDGLKEGQMFDENLKPILPESAVITSENSRPILTSGQRTRVPPKSAAVPRTRLRSSQRLPTGNLRSSTVASSTGSTRRTDTIVPQTTLPVRAGPLTNTISSEIRRSQTLSRITPGDSLRSGTVLFNGKEISVDGIKEGQIFDENLRPILPGSSGIAAQRAATLSNSAQISGASLRSPIPKPVSRPQQRLQAQNLRSFGITSSSRGTTSNIRRTNTVIPQPAPAIRAGQLSNMISSAQRNTQLLGGAKPTGSLTSGSVLFNGEEISMDGFKEGQLFDENLQPITSGISGLVSEKSSNLPGFSSTGRISPANLPSSIPIAQSQVGRLRSSVTGISSSSRSPGVASSGFIQNIRPGTLATGIPTTSGAQETASGTVFFNGKEIKIDGLTSGQIFDENLNPVTTGISGDISDRSINVIGSSREGSPRIIPKPRVISPQKSDGGARIRSPVAPGTYSGAFTSSRISGSSGSQSTSGIRTESLSNAISPSARDRGTITSGTALFDGKEITVNGMREGQLFDENLKPILSETSSRLPGRSSATLQSSRGTAPKPSSRSPQRSQVGGLRSSGLTGSLSGVVGSSRTPPSPNLRAGSFGTGIQRISQTSGGTRSGSALFNGKEVSIEGMKPGQLYDENLRPITSGISDSVAERSMSLPGSAQIRGTSLQNLAPKPAVRTSQGYQIGSLRTSPARSSQAEAGTRLGGTLTSGAALFDGKEIRTDSMKEGQLFDETLRPIMPGSPGMQRSQSNRMRAAGVTSSSAAAQSLTNMRAGSATSRGSSPQGASRVSGGISSHESLTSGTVLFNGKEVSIDGLKEGQLFDENLRPINSQGSFAESLSGPNIGSNTQRYSARNFRTGTLSTTSGVTSQTTATRGLPAASGSLSYIDVTRTDELSSSSGPSSENALGGRGANSVQLSTAQRTRLGGASSYASRFGSRVTQDKIMPEISQYGVDTPIDESILNIPGDPFKRQSSMKVPNISKQTQLKVEDVLEQSSLAKPDSLTQETVPFSSIDPSKKTLAKISQISQKDSDIPTVQQKLLEDFSGYLPKTSFLPPFNYAVPQVSTSKYNVKSPLAQVQQKLEHVFV